MPIHESSASRWCKVSLTKRKRMWCSSEEVDGTRLNLVKLLKNEIAERDMSDFDVNYSKFVSCYILGSLYGLLCLTCGVAMFLICFREPVSLRKRQKVFYCLLFALTGIRSVFWFLRPQWESGGSTLNNVLFYTVWTLPALLLLSTYSTLIWWWADQYSKLQSQSNDLQTFDSRRSHFKVVIFINMIMYILEVGLLIMCAVGNKYYSLIQPNFLSGLYVGAIIFFIVYGSLWYKSFKRNTVGSAARIKLHRITQILWTTVIVVTSFVIRAIVNPFWPGYIKNWTYEWVFVAPFYFLVEISPVFFIVTLITKLPQYRSKARHPLLKYDHYVIQQHARTVAVPSSPGYSTSSPVLSPSD